MKFGRSHSIIYFGVGFNLAFMLTVAVLGGVVRQFLPESTPHILRLIGVILPFALGLFFGLRVRRIGQEYGLGLPSALKRAVWR